MRSRPADGNAPGRILCTTQFPLTGIDGAPDGSIYLDEFMRPASLVRRALINTFRAGHRKLMISQEGKEPVPVANTPEDTSTPAAAVGSHEAIFTISNPAVKPRRPQLAISDLSTGVTLRRFTFAKAPAPHMAASPDGKTLYLSAAGFIWSMPASGGDASKLHAWQIVAADPT